MADSDEFVRLVQRSHSAVQPEEELEAIEGALAIEPRIKDEDWPLEISREETRASLLCALAESFVGRSAGNGAAHVDRAIVAYKAAIEQLAGEPFRQQRVVAQIDLGYAYCKRASREPDADQGAAILEDAISAYKSALETWRSGIAPELRGKALSLLGDAYAARVAGDRGGNIDQAIACYLAAEGIFTQRGTPEVWAYTQRDLGNAYRQRGKEGANTERAIAAYEAALSVFTQDRSPEPWGEVHHNLAAAYQEREGSERAENLERAITSYRLALRVRTRDALPEDWARTTNDLGLVYYRRVRGERAGNVEKAIELYKAAQGVFSRQSFPRQWRIVQGNLANAYCDRVLGERIENREQAVDAQLAALALLSRETEPEDWARAHANLGRIWHDRIAGDRADNLENAIASYEAALEVLTRDAYRQDWAKVQTSLGNSLRERRRGDVAANIEDAIAAHHAALTVVTPESMPEEWARTQHNLGLASEERILGSRAENLELAIKCYESALSVRTLEEFPYLWAMTKSNLGAAYQRRVHGGRADNIEQAIANTEAALGIYRQDALPEEWAGVQNNLATAYMERIHGERAENLERAIGAFEAALTVYTQEAFPQRWAVCQNNLGSCFHNRRRGKRADNLERAIAACSRALAVRTPEAQPLGWAGTQQNLADCYVDRIEGNRADNLERAAEAYRAALSVFTPEALPRDHLTAAARFGRVLLEMGQYHAAQAMLAGARETFLGLFGLGLDEEDGQDVIASAGELFSQAAYAAAHLGDAWGAFALLMDGKARLMSVRLHQQQFQLLPEARDRAETLRREIRLWAREAESAEGVRGTAALQHISSLRAELAALMQAASHGRPSRTDVDVARTALQLTSAGAVIMAPIVTETGGKLLVVSAGQEKPVISMFELAQTSTRQLEALMFGDAKRGGEAGGWRSAYNKNYEMAQLRAAIGNTLRGSHEHDFLLGRHEALMGEWLDAVESLAGELWRVLGSSIESALRSIGIKPGGRAIWLPTGALGILPIGLAQDPRGGRRLGETYEIVYGPSLDVLATASARVVSVEAPSLAMINPASGLTSTDFEANVVASHFPSDRRSILEKDEATIEAVLASLRGRSHWHFATHGTFDWGYARRSALQLSGGERLTIGMLAEAEGLVPPRLVALSACETGIYEFWRNADEFVGLPGTFMALGAAGVVGTLWPVEDRATALLMAKFYDLHLAERTAPATALHRAQVWLRQATRAELIRYAMAVTAKGGAAQELVGNKLAGSLIRGGHDDPRFASVSKLLDRRSNASMKRRSGLLGRILGRRAQSRPWERPFAHPYYWGGFIYTGV